MTSIIKVFLKKCVCEKNKRLFQLLFENIEIIVKNKYKLDFYALDKKKIKTLKNINPNTLPIFTIKNNKYEGLKQIRNFISSLNSKKIHDSKYIINKKNNFTSAQSNTRTMMRGQFLLEDEDEEKKGPSIEEKMNNELRSREINIDNNSSRGVNINTGRSRTAPNVVKKPTKRKIYSSKSNLQKAIGQPEESTSNKKDKQDKMLDDLLENIQQTPIQYMEE